MLSTCARLLITFPLPLFVSRVIHGRAMTDVAGGITVAATVRTMHAMRGRVNGRTRAQGNALSVVRAADAVPCSTAWNSSERVCGQPVW